MRKSTIHREASSSLVSQLNKASQLNKVSQLNKGLSQLNKLNKVSQLCDLPHQYFHKDDKCMSILLQFAFARNSGKPKLTQTTKMRLMLVAVWLLKAQVHINNGKHQYGESAVGGGFRAPPVAQRQSRVLCSLAADPVGLHC